MKKVEIPSIEKQLEALAKMRDEDIDFSDIPEIKDFTGFQRGRFYRPIKKPVTLRLDSDIVEWFRKHHSKYQTAINTALRQYVLAQQTCSA